MSEVKLFTSTVEGRILFLLEFEGQISDGMWENSSGNHWRQWALSENEIAVDPENPGTTFWPTKTFGLGSKELYDVVGDRMKAYLNIYAVAGVKFLRFINDGNSNVCENLREYDSMYKGALANDDYYTRKYLLHQQYGLTRNVFEQAETSPTYDDAQTKKIIRQLSKDCKTRRA